MDLLLVKIQLAKNLLVREGREFGSISAVGGTNIGVATHAKISINREVRTQGGWKLKEESGLIGIKGSASGRLRMAEQRNEDSFRGQGGLFNVMLAAWWSSFRREQIFIVEPPHQLNYG